jgi:hypothetical protein
MTFLTRIDAFLTLSIYDGLRFISRVTRRYADRINRLADIDTLRGYHAYPGEESPKSYGIQTWNRSMQQWGMLTAVESDMERARR